MDIASQDPVFKLLLLNMVPDVSPGEDPVVRGQRPTCRPAQQEEMYCAEHQSRKFHSYWLGKALPLFDKVLSSAGSGYANRKDHIEVIYGVRCNELTRIITRSLGLLISRPDGFAVRIYHFHLQENMLQKNAPDYLSRPCGWDFDFLPSGAYLVVVRLWLPSVYMFFPL